MSLLGPLVGTLQLPHDLVTAITEAGIEMPPSVNHGTGEFAVAQMPSAEEFVFKYSRFFFMISDVVLSHILGKRVPVRTIDVYRKNASIVAAVPEEELSVTSIAALMRQGFISFASDYQAHA